jgi:aspartate racemase
MEKKTLGIVGGVGPLATMLLGEMIVRRTNASKDQEHVDMVITNNTKIPDRTAYVLDRTKPNPVTVMISDIHRLTSIGAEIIAIPCNTAHSFYAEMQQASSVPILNMIEETVKRASEEGVKRLGILATTGTVTAGVYQDACEKAGIVPVIPDGPTQEKVMSIIYDYVKANKPADRKLWNEIEFHMIGQQCDQVILGCTELSIVREELNLQDLYLDSLLVLAEESILACGYKLNK